MTKQPSGISKCSKLATERCLLKVWLIQRIKLG
ncbi:Uncharacterised protein [Vibrio cholerae]|nr:Uncharacterised protein [Vibrio cholerae]